MSHVNFYSSLTLTHDSIHGILRIKWTYVRPNYFCSGALQLRSVFLHSTMMRSAPAGQKLPGEPSAPASCVQLCEADSVEDSQSSSAQPPLEAAAELVINKTETTAAIDNPASTDKENTNDGSLSASTADDRSEDDDCDEKAKDDSDEVQDDGKEEDKDGCIVIEDDNDEDEDKDVADRDDSDEEDDLEQPEEEDRSKIRVHVERLSADTTQLLTPLVPNAAGRGRRLRQPAASRVSSFFYLINLNKFILQLNQQFKLQQFFATICRFSPSFDLKVVLCVQEAPRAAAEVQLPDFLTCGTCLAHFRLEHILQFIQHKAAHSSRPPIVFHEDSPPSTPPKLCCSLCPLEPKSPESLLIHLRDEHNVKLY